MANPWQPSGVRELIIFTKYKSELSISMTKYQYINGLIKDANPKNTCPITELKAKFFSPPAVRNKGFMATCKIVIHAPIIKSETRAILKEGNTANSIVPINHSIKARIIAFFSAYFSTSIPAGIEKTPNAIKKENCKNPAIPMLKSKSLIISGIIGPIIFVKNEIVKKTSIISPTRNIFFFILKK